MGCIGDMLLHCAILYVVVDVITSIICTTYTYKVLHKFFILYDEKDHYVHLPVIVTSVRTCQIT
jgi:hypothetical protein